MKCKNCGHEIKQATEYYRKGKWYHRLFYRNRWQLRNLCLAPCKCRNPEPKKEDDGKCVKHSVVL